MGEVFKAVLEIGLAPTLLIVVLYWMKETTERRARYLEEQNKRLLDIVERLMEGE